MMQKAAHMVELLRLLACALPLACCSASPCDEELRYTMIPDQVEEIEQARAAAVTAYLQDYLNHFTSCSSSLNCVQVTFVPAVDYPHAVELLVHQNVDFAWYGGLTGMQASLATGLSLAEAALAQRFEDTQFTSTFIQRNGLNLDNDLVGVDGRTIAFGSEVSTSGHLMPAYYLQQAGVTPSSLIFTGSHDATVDAVGSGHADVGALNSLTWERRVRDGTQGAATPFFTTPAYVDYLWLAGDTLHDKTCGNEVGAAFLSLAPSKASSSAFSQAVLDSFSTVGFIAVDPLEYGPIVSTGCQLGLIEKRYCKVSKKDKKSRTAKKSKHVPPKETKQSKTTKSKKRTV